MTGKKYFIVCFITILFMCFTGCQSKEMKAAVSKFEAAVSEAEAKNSALESEIETAERLINANNNALDESLYPLLERAITDAKAAKVTIPDKPKKIEEVISATAELKNIDYSLAIEALEENRSNLEKSIEKYKLVDAPNEAYILKCLKKVPNIIDIVACTEETDHMNNLNKDGWYIARILFSCTLVNQEDVYGATLFEKGTDAGGSIEVYRTKEEAEKRDEYLASFDGSITDSGSHIVVGTCVVRTSDSLTATQQNSMEVDIIEILTLLPDEECSFVQIPASIEKPQPDVVSPEFKEIMDSYETIIDEYIEFLTQYTNSNDNDYTIDNFINYENKCNEVIDKINDIDSGKLSEANLAYYIEVCERISKKSADISVLIDNLPDGIPTKEEKPEKPKTSRNEQAVKDAIEIANTYATVYPYMVRDILMEDYGYSDTQAIYAIKNADIDWNYYAVIHAKEYVLINEWLVTKEDIATHLGAEKGYTDKAIDYAMKNADIEWDVLGNREVLATRRVEEFAETYSCVSRQYLFDALEPIFGYDATEYALEYASIDWYEQALKHANEIAEETIFEDEWVCPLTYRENLAAEGFTDSEAEYAIENCNADWYELAVRCAEMLAPSSYTRDGMIELLLDDGFTESQAAYGADNCGEDFY